MSHPPIPTAICLITLLSAGGAQGATALAQPSPATSTTTQTTTAHQKTTVAKTHHTAKAAAKKPVHLTHKTHHNPLPAHHAVKSVLHHAPPRSAVVTIPTPAPATPPPVPATPPPAPKGAVSGLPLPRFAALHADQVALRTGPGKRYPIDWIYQRRFLPVEIEREFDDWRLVTEPDGAKGWVHVAMLTNKRGFIVTGDQPQTLRDTGADTGAAVAILKPGVVGQLLTCPAGNGWCRVQVKTYQGWLPRTAFWGTLPDEAVGP